MLYLAVPSQTGDAPAVPPAHARAAVAATQGVRVTAIEDAIAHEAGLGAGARLPSSALSICNCLRRAIPVRALYLAVPPPSGCAPAVSPAHARAAVAFTRGAHVNAIAGANAHGAGLRGGAHLPSLKPSSYVVKRRVVPSARALSCHAVSHWRCCPAHVHAALAITRGARVTSIDRATAPGAGLGAGAGLSSSAPSLRTT